MDDSRKSHSGAACFRCRGHRHACDRQKPSCSRCQRRDIACQYPEATPSLGTLKQATDNLDTRIQSFRHRLETRLVTQTQGHSGSTLLSSSTSSSSSSTTSSSSSSSSLSSSSSPSSLTLLSTDTFTVPSLLHLSIYPCVRCSKDLQPCDLRLPQCSRCENHDSDCRYNKTEPKVTHVFQVLASMNRIMDQWQICVNQTIKARRARFAWKIILMAEGLRVETNVRSFHGLATLVDQIRRAMTTQDEDESVGLTIHSTPGFYAIWNEWCHPRRYILPQDYPIDISQEQTDSLVELYCRTPCCYAPRLPLIDTAEFMARYTGPPAHRPSALLVYAVCAMAARNAFQLHVWGNRPSYESPQYNIGKPLSIAYCLRARELLAESFDEPSLDNCQAALLLSYCSHQNGYPSVIYFYEWIAFTMAQQLGLYDSGRRLTRQENMLVWCLYYFNTWYRVLRGGTSTSLKWSQFFPHCPLPMVLPRPEKEEDLAEYYTQNMWVYFIELQLLRDDTMARFVAAQDIETNKNLLRDVQEMQCKLDAFYARLPSDWQQSQCLTERPTQRCCNDLNEGERYQVNISSFGQFCTQAVQVQYHINKILLHQAFLPFDHSPTTPFSINCLCICIDAADFIIRTLEVMINEYEGCCVPLIGVLFSSLVYHKLLNYGDGYYRDLARRCLKRSLDLAKASKSYKYDFEMARTMVDLLEQNIPIS